jgi:cyclopropane fatty-acyl-phospholipid synthase-like methyltransferase
LERATELDASRVAVAAASPSPRVSVRNADVRDLPEAGGYSAVLAMDVLHHIAFDEHGAILGALRDRLEPGGLCLVKDIAVTPSWKHAWNRAHDRLVTGSAEVSCREPEDMARLLESAGLEVERVRRLSPASPYPHYLVRARRPAA